MTTLEPTRDTFPKLVRWNVEDTVLDAYRGAVAVMNPRRRWLS